MPDPNLIRTQRIDAALADHALVASIRAAHPTREDHTMEARHTPGPWYTANTGNHQGLIISERNGANVAIAYDAKANARLIAAAPDLLAALNIARHALDNSIYDRPTMATIDAAIAKATA